MNRHGENAPLYVAARQVLLDALQAIGDHREAVVLVGAQAVYLHTGDAELAVAPFTVDADLALDPGLLADEPLMDAMLREADFQRDDADVGVWRRMILIKGGHHSMPVDFLVPESLGGEGRRAARIPPHATGMARKVAGLEGTLVDNVPMEIHALDDTDSRAFTIRVAGPASLLVAKSFKIADRAGEPGRVIDKDALDVFRLLQTQSTDTLAAGMRRLLAHDVSAQTATTGIQYLGELFGTRSAPGCVMATRATAGLEDPVVLTTSLALLAGDLLKAL